MKRLIWFILASLMLAASYSFAGEQIQPDLNKHSSNSTLEPSTFVTINGRSVPTQLSAWVNHEAFDNLPDWDTVKNGTLSFEPLNPRGVKFTIKFDKRVSRNFFFDTKRPWDLCIASYLFPLKEYDANTIGSDKYLPPDLGWGAEGLLKISYAIGFNTNEDIKAIVADQPISWGNLMGQVVDMDAMKETSAYQASRCLKFMNPAYVDQDGAALYEKIKALPNVCPNGTVRQLMTAKDMLEEREFVTDWVRNDQAVIQETDKDIQKIEFFASSASPRRPFMYIFRVQGKERFVYAVVNADRLCDKPRFSLMCTTREDLVAKTIADPKHALENLCKQ